MDRLTKVFFLLFLTGSIEAQTSTPGAPPSSMPTIAQILSSTMPPNTMDQGTTMQPTTMQPTTKKPTTMQPTTMQPTTMPPTTMPPTTMQPTTMDPMTKQPTTMPPTTMPPATTSMPDTTTFKEPPPTTTTTTMMPTTTTTMMMMSTTPSTDCYLKKADIVFLLDSSTSEGRDNFKKQLDYVRNTVRSLDVRPDGVRVGLVTFSDDAHLQFYMNEHMDPTELQQALQYVPYQEGATHTEDGLRYIREKMFMTSAGGRDNAQNVVVVLTDGQSTDPSTTLKEARLLRNNGSIIISVGIGTVDEKELNGIASGNNYTLKISDFDALGENVDSTLKLVCDAINGVDGGKLFVPCQERAVDLAILLDASGSEGLTHFREQTDFAANFVSKLDVGATKTQIGAITFGTDISRQFFLNQYDDTSSLVDAIKKIPYTGGTTNTQKALQFMRTTFFTPGFGRRPGTPKVILIMTDGKSTNPTQTRLEANRLKQEGYIIYTVGIGDNLDMSEINAIATGPETIFQVKSFDDLKAFLPTLEKAYCDKVDNIVPFVPTPDPNLADCNKPTDLVFVLDSSSSEGSNNFRKQIYFAGNITMKLNISPNDVQVSVVAFSTLVHNMFYLNRYKNKYDVLDALFRTPFYTGATYTNDALRFVRQQTLSTLHGRRLGAQPIVIILTDGRSSEKQGTLAEAQLLQSTGAVVIAIGIGGNTDDTELTAIASDPSHKFTVNNFDFLVSIQEQILFETCEGGGPPPTAHPECGDKPADIVFLMDASSSEGPSNFEKMKSFIADFSSKFVVGKGHVQISCVAFSTSVHVEFALNETSNRQELLQKITNIRFYGGTTMTDKALEVVRTTVLTAAGGARPGAKDTVILLTDGQSVVASETRRQAELLKKTGAQVITIGVGSSVDTRELENIASDFQHAFTVINFDALKTIEEELVQTACTACGETEKADIMILIDSSSDESNMLFKQEIDFVSNLVKTFKIGPQNMQFSLMTFATKPNLEFWFNTYDNSNDILDALPKVIYTQGDTNTDEALKFAREYGFIPPHGARADANQYVIVVTDGTTKNLTKTIAEANLLKQQGVTVMAVGIGNNADKTELESIATDSSHVFIADNADALKALHKDVSTKTCKSIFALKATTPPPFI